MKILIVDDDEALRPALAANLGLESWEILQAANGSEALEKVEGVDVVVTDIRLPDKDGLDLLSEIRARHSDLEVIVMTGYSSIPSAVEAMRRGARAYLAKPFEPEELIAQLKEVEQKLKWRSAALSAGRGELVGSSAQMRRVYAEIDAAAESNAPVLITGETGTGKEGTARAVHDASRKRPGPFVPVNLGALPRELVESELFGHEKGAFTGAHARKKGRFALADGGSIFLDEIDSLPIDLQPKLLRALESREIWPLGSEKALTFNARIIAATNARIEDLVKKQAFREDLYYRLNVLRIELPPLRDRPEDIPSIARSLIERVRSRMEIKAMVDISAEGLSWLMTHAWNGNVRELANILERALSRASRAPQDGKPIRIELEHFDAKASSSPVAALELPFNAAKAKVIEDWSRATISAALAATNGNVTEAARNLQLNRTFLLSLIKKYRIRE